MSQSHPQNASPESPPRPWETIHSPAGTFTTVREDGVVRAWGLRYAEAERFEAPRPCRCTGGSTEGDSPEADSPEAAIPDPPFHAETRAPACPQRHSPQDTELLALGFDEHCQRLSITRPDSEATDLPVLIWLHGGSYVGGAGDLPHYDPRWLVTEHQIIVVSVTYRLGLFGYLGDGISREANPGLLDQAAAVDWVHRNIAAIGGDPEQITIAGQSAGGHSCFDLLLIPELRGKISRAILQSGPLGIVHGRSRKVWEALAPAASSTESMRAASTDQLTEGESCINRLALRRGTAKFMPFSTRYGARPLPPEEEIAQQWIANAGHVEILMGTTSREVALFLGAVRPLLRLGRTRLGRRLVIEPLVSAMTAMIYRRDHVRWHRRYRRAGGQSRLYRFVFGDPQQLLSCCHLAELPLLFPHPVWHHGTEEAGAGVTGPQLMQTYPPEHRDRAGRELRAVWGGFIRHGVSAVPADGIPGVLEVERSC